MSTKKLLLLVLLSICFIPSKIAAAKEIERTLGSIGNVRMLGYNELILYTGCVHPDTHIEETTEPYLCGGIITRTTTICNMCGKSIGAASSIRIGDEHTYNEGIILKKATGTKVRYTCTVCGYTKDVWLYSKKIATAKVRSVKSKKKGIITVAVEKVPEITGYQIQISKRKNFKNAVSKYTKKEKIVVKMKRKKKYYIRVRAYIDIGNSRQFGRWSKVRVVRVK